MSGRPWIPAEDRALATLYPHLRSDDIARILGRPLSGIYARAHLLGLAKSAAYNASPLSGRNVKGHAPNGAGTRFKPGHVPANKGRKGYCAPGSEKGWFRKGIRSATYMEVGSLRLSHDGYVEIKTRDAPGASAWYLFHVLLWEDAHGPLNRRRHCLIFKDGDRLNVDLDNLERITRAQNMRRNSIHNLPQPLRHTVQVLGQLTRRIREKQNRRSA